jgi:hypothetical protein
VSSNIVRNPSRLDEDFKAQQKLEFDRWRIAVQVVKRMREAGISSELSNDFEAGH